MKDIALSWSSGKDAAYALLQLQKWDDFRVKKLFSTLDQEKERVSMHGIRESLLDAQANALGIPIRKVFLPENLSMSSYDRIIQKEYIKIKSEEVHTLAFGDILLDDLKTYREKQLKSLKMNAVFPIWKINTTDLAHKIIRSGIKAIVVTINRKVLDNSFLGRIFDLEFLADLPSNVDPCGENGEFHTFVYDAPNFRFPVEFLKGEVVKKQYHSGDKNTSWDTSFLFQDLILK